VTDAHLSNTVCKLKKHQPCLLNGTVQLVDQANTFALSFSLAGISSDCDILLRRPEVSIQLIILVSVFQIICIQVSVSFDCYHFSFYIVSVSEIFLFLLIAIISV